MRWFRFFLVGIVAVSTFFCCSKTVVIPNSNTSCWDLQTKGVTIDNSYFVSEEDITNYLKHQNMLLDRKGASMQSPEITPLLYQEKIVLYLVNYGTRWELFAADKRLPHILAYSETGDFDSTFFLEEGSAWFENYVPAVLLLKEDPSFLGVTETDRTEIEKNLNFWRKQSGNPTAPEDVIQEGNRYGEGHWELTDSYEYYEFVSQTGHLLPTDWHQFSPYNNCCPLIPGDPFQSRFPSGSTTLATALWLYHYHNVDGSPAAAPTLAGVILNPGDTTYYYYSDHYTETVWDYMTSVPDSCAALIGVLWGQTGTEVNYNNMTESDISWFVNHYLDHWNLSGQLDQYDTREIDTYLLSGYPALISVSANRSWWFGYTYYNHHTYLIDAYQKFRWVGYYYYEWITDNPGPNEMIPEPIIEMKYGLPLIKYYGINFCAGDNASTVWFAKSDALTYYNVTYQYNRLMAADVIVIGN